MALIYRHNPRFLIGLSLIFVTACDKEPNPKSILPLHETVVTAPVSPQSNKAIADIANASNAIGTTIIENQAVSTDNYVASPATNALIVAMLASSASGGTKKSIEDWLTFSTPDKHDPLAFNNYPLALATQPNANGSAKIEFLAWGQSNYKFQSDYLNILANSFGTELEREDFILNQKNKSLAIERWLTSSFTKDNESALPFLNTLDDKTRVFGAVKTHWDSPWRKIDNEVVEPEIIQGLWQGFIDYQQRVPMVKWQGHFPRYVGEDFDGVKVTLPQADLSLTVIMPKEGKFEDLQKRLKEVLAEFDKGHQMKDVEFALPIFKTKTQDSIFPYIGTERYFRTKCDEKGGCQQVSMPLPSSATDFKVINGAGFLYVDSIIANSEFEVAKAGVSVDNTAAFTLKATEDEPNSLFTEPNQSHFGSSWTTQNVSVNLDCYRVYETAGPTQSRPFLYFIRNEKTGAIIATGRTSSLPGERVGKNVCREELLTYADNIWPVEPKTESSSLSTLTDFQPTAYLPTQLDAKKQTIKSLALQKTLQNFSATDNTINVAFGSYTESQITLRLIAATDPSQHGTLIHSIAPGLNSTDVLSSLRYPLFDFDQHYLTAWSEKDYIFNKDFLEVLSYGPENDWRTHDFSNSESPFTDIDSWVKDLIDITPSTYFGHPLTRLLVGDQTKFSASWSTQPIYGTFEVPNSTPVITPTIRFSGTYPYFEDEKIRAIEIPFSNRNSSLLVLMPKSGHFNEIKGSLSTVIDEIDSKIEQSNVVFDLPELSIYSTNLLTTNFVPDVNLSGATAPRPSVLDQTRAYTRVELSNTGIDLRSVALATISAPGNTFSFPFLTYDPIGWSNMQHCGEVPAVTPLSQIHPYIFLLRDSDTKTILFSGQVTNVKNVITPDPSCVRDTIEPIPILLVP